MNLARAVAILEQIHPIQTTPGRQKRTKKNKKTFDP